MKTSTLVTDLCEFYKILTDKTKTVDNVVELTQEAVLVTTSPAETEFEDCLPNTNVVIADFTTAQARLKLLEEMEKLDDRCLYTDTGKCTFLHANL